MPEGSGEPAGFFGGGVGAEPPTLIQLKELNAIAPKEYLMPQTLAEQILSHAAGQPVAAGQNVVVNVDLAMMHDSISPSIIKILHGELGAARVWDPERIAVVVEHVAPAA